MPYGKYRDLNYCVAEYKKKPNTPTNREKCFKFICEHLTHHIHSTVNILKGTNVNVNINVYKMIRKGFEVCMCMGPDNKNFDHTIKLLANEYSENDVKQYVYQVIIDLLNLYRHPKLTFLEFVTYLLPRRMASILQKNSKDATAQFSSFSFSPVDDSEENERERTFDSIFNYKDENINYSEELFISDEIDSLEQSIISDYNSNIPTEKIIEKYNFLNKGILMDKVNTIIIKQFNFQFRSIKIYQAVQEANR